MPVRVLGKGHRVLDADSGLPDIQGVRLALYAGSGLSRAGKELQEQLRAVASVKPQVARR